MVWWCMCLILKPLKLSCRRIILKIGNWILIPLFSFSIVCTKPTVRFYVEKNVFTDQFLFSLKSDFLENFKVNFQYIEIDSNSDNEHLLKSTLDGSILADNNIMREINTYNIFLTDKPLTFEVDSIEVRGFSFMSQAVSIVSTHRIKIESAQFDLPFEFQFKKAIKHEFLHLYGLDHCSQTPKCIMVASVPPSNFHYSKDRTCSFCARKIEPCLITKRLFQF